MYNYSSFSYLLDNWMMPKWSWDEIHDLHAFTTGTGGPETRCKLGAGTGMDVINKSKKKAGAWNAFETRTCSSVAKLFLCCADFSMASLRDLAYCTMALSCESVSTHSRSSRIRISLEATTLQSLICKRGRRVMEGACIMQVEPAQQLVLM